MQSASDGLPDLSNRLGLRDLWMPWPVRRHAQFQFYLERSREIAVHTGLISGEANDRSTRRFLSFAPLCGFAYCEATLDGLWTAGGFDQWLFFLDDHYDDDPEVGQSAPAVRALIEANAAVLLGDRRPGDTAMERFGASVHHRFRHAGPRWWRRFRRDLEDYLFEGSLVALQTWREGRILDVDAYRERRCYDSSVFACIDVMELAMGLDLPDEVVESPAIRTLRLLTTEHVAFLNDIVSYHKEVVEHQSPFNLVHVLMHHRHLTLADAVHEIVTLLNDHVARFDEIAATLPSYGPDLDAQIAVYLTGMRRWMAGNRAFSFTSGRYIRAESGIADLRKASVLESMLAD